MRYFIHLNYNGKNFKGWQKQTDTPTIQSELESAFSTVFQQSINITGCGRTDAGVHAQSYYAHFDFDKAPPKNHLLRINKILPESIGVFNIFRVKPEINSRFEAINRTYKYFIHFKKDAFLQDKSFWLFNYDFDLNKMNEAANLLLQQEDFFIFEKKGSDNRTTLCDVSYAEWEVVNKNQWCFTITANRFLRNMVRRITGTLLMVGLNRLSIEELRTALNKRDVLKVNIAPPAHGLFLWAIDYPENIIFE